MRVRLNGSGASIDETPLGPRMNGSAIAAFMGPAVSSREIPMHPTGVRKANVSASGVVWYVDYPEDRVSHLHFALSPDDTPERPAFTFAGSIAFNGVDLTADISEATFSSRGEVLSWVRGHHHTWSSETGAHYISFVFRRCRNRVGKRSGAYRLACVSISFRDEQPPEPRTVP